MKTRTLVHLLFILCGSLSSLTAQTSTPLAPVLQLESFYESAAGTTVVVDASPTDGYPQTYSYQWYFNGFAIAGNFGGTASSYQFLGEADYEGSWRVQVSNTTGTTTVEFEYRVFADADGDGLSDYRETNLLLTNPNLADSDSDGLNDFAEINTYSTDPNLADSDSDGLNDFAELNTHSTDPNDADSSGDGISDGVLVGLGFDPNTDYSNIAQWQADRRQNLRSGAEIAPVVDGAATLQMVLEESDDLSTWSKRETIDLVVPLVAGEASESFRYSLKGAAAGGGSQPVFPVPSEADQYSLIAAGSFTMGDGLDGLSDAPVHSVNVSGFYMGKHEVSWSQWQEVRDWAVSNGYSDLSGIGSGVAGTHPVQTVNWYDVVKWCNAASERAGLPPVYRVSNGGAVYRTGELAPYIDYTQQGYRLPTEAEWEKAARGGSSGKRFLWGDLISHDNANYSANGSAYSYDVSPYSSYTYHPSYNDGSTPYTSPVGSFAGNGYGLYDMSGNVWEWCNDWYGSSYYSSSPGSDPAGPTTGTIRVHRGGSWRRSALNCRVAYRFNNLPADRRGNDNGFRLVLSE